MTWRDRLFVLAQSIVPQRALTRLVHHATRWRFEPWHRLLIGAFIRCFRPNLDEAASSDPGDYRTFNDFFTRALREGARHFDCTPQSIVSPVDGTVSQIGAISGQMLMQAKERRYSLSELLGEESAVDAFRDGLFVTLYLAPGDYHRVHMPVNGRLRRTRYIPGRLFSVNARSTELIDRLFARNERLVCLFDTDPAPLALVMVGAICVAGIETVWSGLIRSPSRVVGYPDAQLRQGQELGRFNMGSTVILLLPAQSAEWSEALRPGHGVRVGQRIGRLRRTLSEPQR